MAKRTHSEEQGEFATMETPKDVAVERASKSYRKIVSERLEIQKREATAKAKVAETVLKWADTNGIKPKHSTNDKGVEIEEFIYLRGDVKATAERPLKWNVKVSVGEEVEEEIAEAAAQREQPEETPEDES